MIVKPGIKDAREAWRNAITNRCVDLADKIPSLQKSNPARAELFERLLIESRGWLDDLRAKA